MKIIIVIALLSLTAFLIAPFLPDGADWSGVFRPASLALLQGKSPYSVYMFYHAPWLLLPLLPFSLLPLRISRAFLFIAALIAYTFTARRAGANKLTLIAFLLSPPLIASFFLASVDWIPILGLVLPAPIGLFFIITKPQIGIAVGVLWLFESYRLGGIPRVIKTFAPVTIAMILSILIYGNWPLLAKEALTMPHNASFFPQSLPIGLALLVSSIRMRRIEPAVVASPLLAPYIMLSTYSGAMLSILKLPFETVATVIGLWILVALRY